MVQEYKTGNIQVKDVFDNARSFSECQVKKQVWLVYSSEIKYTWLGCVTVCMCLCFCCFFFRFYLFVCLLVFVVVVLVVFFVFFYCFGFILYCFFVCLFLLLFLFCFVFVFVVFVFVFVFVFFWGAGAERGCRMVVRSAGSWSDLELDKGAVNLQEKSMPVTACTLNCVEFH